MHTVFSSIAMAFSMFSILPMPRQEWSKDNMRSMLAAFPLVGLAVGLALFAWFCLSQALGFGSVLFAAGMTALPILLSGGIHMDGLCDVADAVCSRAPMERKKEILKDPRCGAFAVIAAGTYLIGYLGLCTELNRSLESILFMALIHTLSRALGGLATVWFPTAESGWGLMKTLREAAGQRVTLILFCWIALTALGMMLIHAVWGAAALLGALIVLVGTYLTAKKQFGGMSGDQAGCCIQTAELTMLGLLILLQKAVA